MYALPPELKQRLWHFEEHGNSSLSAELALCRSLLEKAAAEGNTTAAINLLSVLSKISREVELQRLRESETLTRDAVARFTRFLINEISETFRAADFPGWEDRLDALSIRLGDQLTLTENENDSA